MSEREKRALAAETRFATTQGKTQLCDFCSVPLTMVPFERLEYKYCTLECVRKHMDELEKQKPQQKKKTEFQGNFKSKNVNLFLKN